MDQKNTTKTNNNQSNKSWLVYVLLLLLLLGLAAIFAAKENLVRFLNVDVNKDKTVVIGQRGADGKAGVNGLDGTSGSSGQNGSSGSSGAAGAIGAQGVPGSNDCISGICVSRQASTPGTQETGNINIDGAVIAAQAGIGTSSPSNTLTVNGTVDVSGHSAFGGDTVNGYTNRSDGLSGTTSNITTMIVSEELTSITGSSINRQALATGLVLNPGAAPVYNQISGVVGGVEIASGNTQNFSGNLSGYGGGFIHSGTGAVTIASSYNAGMLNLSTGTITNGNSFNSNVINLNAGGTLTNAHGLQASVINLGTITNNYGVKINTPTNGGTVTNNYGLYVADQSTVGSVINLNLASMGLTSNNWLQGFVGIGNITGPLDGQVHIVNDGSGNSFKVSDTGYADTSPFVIDADGDVGIGVASPSYKLDVNGVVRGTKFSGVSGGTTWLTADGSNSGLFVTDAANPQTGSNRSFHITTGAGESVPAFSVTGGGAANVVAVVKGAASQTANLQEWQNDSGSVMGSIAANGAVTFDSRTASTFLSVTNSTSGKTLRIGDTTNATSNWNIENSYGAMFFYNATAGGDTSIDLYDNTNVGIGTTFSGASSKLTVKDSASAGSVLSLQNTAGTCTHTPTAGAETVSCSSDERLKTNIVDAASVLSEINGLKIHDYTVIANGLETTGLIAQEVLQTNPSMVHMGDDGYYKVDSYNPWKVLKGIQELSAGQTDLNTSFVTALAKTNGDLAATNELLSAQGIKLDTISTELKALADRVDVLETKNVSQDAEIDELKTQLQQLKQQINTTP